MIKSISYDQNEIIKSIMDLCEIERFDVDLTYGNGGFYKNLERPEVRIDIDDSLPDINHKGTSTETGLDEQSVVSVMFDPPFLTYIRQGREHNSIMAKRFSGYWSYSELESHYRDTLKEAHRILKHKGILVFKCQDIIHNHKMHPTHINIVNWADGMFRLKDLFVLNAKHRIPVGGNRKQKHARIYHSYFLVLERSKNA